MQLIERLLSFFEDLFLLLRRCIFFLHNLYNPKFFKFWLLYFYKDRLFRNLVRNHSLPWSIRNEKFLSKIISDKKNSLIAFFLYYNCRTPKCKLSKHLSTRNVRINFFPPFLQVLYKLKKEKKNSDKHSMQMMITNDYSQSVNAAVIYETVGSERSAVTRKKLLHRFSNLLFFFF